MHYSLYASSKTLVALCLGVSALGLRAATVDIPASGAASSPATTAGGSLKGEYWQRPTNTIFTDGSTVAAHRIDTQINGFGAPSGRFTATSFVYLGNDLTPVATWLGSDSASFTGTTGNLDDGAFRFRGFINVVNPGILNIGTATDDGSRITIGALISSTLV